jgi:hypothetical protein
MFIGHFALGYAAKRWAPGCRLPRSSPRRSFADLLWPVLVALGIEQVRIVPGNHRFNPARIHLLPVLRTRS